MNLVGHKDFAEIVLYDAFKNIEIGRAAVKLDYIPEQIHLEMEVPENWKVENVNYKSRDPDEPND